MTYAVRVAITMNIYNFYFFSLRVFYCYVWSCTHLSSFILFGISYIIPDLMSSFIFACGLTLAACCFHITSALPDQGLQLRWQNSTDKEGCQRHALWSVVFYLFLLIPDPLIILTPRLAQWIRDQASNPIFNVVSPHTRTGFGLFPDRFKILRPIKSPKHKPLPDRSIWRCIH